MNKKLLRTSVIASVMAMAFTASAWASNYNTISLGSLDGQIHDSVTWDGAYFNQQAGFPDLFGTASLMNPGTDKEPNTIYTFNYGGGQIQGVNLGTKDNPKWVYNFNAFSTDTVATGITLEAAVVPTSWNSDWDKVTQVYTMDYAATMAAFEAERRILADNALHLDDVKDITHSVNNGILTTNVIGNDGKTIATANADLSGAFVDNDTKLASASLSVNDNGDVTVKVRDSSQKEVSATANIADYVNNQIYNNSGNAKYDGNTTINQQITKNKTDIAQNTTHITNNKNEIDNIKKKYVQQITENNAGDAWTVTQTDGGTITIKDTFVTGVTHNLDADGNLVTTVFQNQGKDPITASVKIGNANITYNDNGTVSTKTIENAINQNTQYINNIQNNNVTNVTKQVTNDDRDIWNVTQTVDGTSTTVEITDEHINSHTMVINGDRINSKITTNFGGNFEQSVRVGDATINYAGDITVQNQDGTTTQVTKTIENAINNNYNKIVNVENNNVSYISQRTEGTEDIGGKTYNVEYYEVTQKVNGQDVPVKIKDTTLVEKRMFSGHNPGWIDGYSDNNAIAYKFDEQTGIPQLFVEFEDTSGNVVQGAIDIGTLYQTTVDTTDGNINVTRNGLGFGNYYSLDSDISIDNSLTVANTVKITNQGIDMNNTKIINLADGEISATSTEAINGSQLYQTNQNLDRLGSRVDKVGAGAAALAALHPMDFDPDDKLQFSAGVGNYGGETAAALGAFYRPTEKVMFSMAGTMGNGENMVNAGVTFALDRKNNVSNSRVAMAHEIQDLRDQVAALTALVTQLAGKGNPLLDTVMFPDVPENHWAYDYIDSLQKRGIIEGYPDGNFGGDRSCTRYEYAAMLYRALEKGFPVDSRLLDEFKAELGRIRIDRIKGTDADANKVERVRVNDYEGRDDYGSKLAQVVGNAAPVSEEPAA
ncbi:MAG: YadA-like family protein [Phascolarctobacterium sp.]|nr:YadA-like family protein [Phascolarctobacterium sp.]